MAKPTRYYVEWLNPSGLSDHGNDDPRDFTRVRNFEDRETALRYRRLKGRRTFAALYERANLVDTTPADLVRDGLAWYSADWDDELIEDH